MSFWVVPGSTRRVDAGVLGVGDVEAEQPRRGGVDGHRRVHRLERDAVQELGHVAEVGDRHADLADLAGRLGRVGVVAGLGGQVEGDRQAGLALGQVGPVELVGRPGRRVARVGAHHPGLVPAAEGRVAPRHRGPAVSRLCSGPPRRRCLPLRSRRYRPARPVATPVADPSGSTSGSRRSPGRTSARAARRPPSGAAAGRPRSSGRGTRRRGRRGWRGEVSRPTRSSRANGPIGNPQPPFMAVSMSSRGHPLLESRTALLR